MFRLITKMGFAWVLALASFLALAQDAALRGPVRIAFIGPLEGVPQAPIAQDALVGARIYASRTNSSGGIAGRKLEIVPFDDKFDPAQTVKKVQESTLVSPSAILTIGTAPALAVLEAKLPESLNLPLIPMRTGAGSVREPLNPFVFHVRAGYRQELQNIVSQLLAVGVERIALLYQDDAFGQYGRGVVRAIMSKNGKSLVAEAAYDRTTADLAPATRKLAASGSDALIMVAGGAQSMQFVAHARDLGYKGQIVGLSDVDPNQLISKVGAQRARNVAISQVFPNLNNAIAHPLVREFKKSIEQSEIPNARPNNATFEGWLSVKFLVEGLRRAAAQKKSLKDALESFRDLDLGSYRLSFSPAQHEGSTLVNLLIIGAEGRIIY
ncbi:MAG: ABC transporter substrate-binding protein [Burkholderiales bacterium]|nr:ABC transporter substrate-binding protein [Burkholderiales bacterium]